MTITAMPPATGAAVIADTLRAKTRVFDSLARYGGEEFVVVMPGTGAMKPEAAERLRVAVEATPFDLTSDPVAADRQHRGRLSRRQAVPPKPAARGGRRALRGQA